MIGGYDEIGVGLAKGTQLLAAMLYPIVRVYQLPRFNKISRKLCNAINIIATMTHVAEIKPRVLHVNCTVGL